MKVLAEQRGVLKDMRDADRMEILAERAGHVGKVYEANQSSDEIIDKLLSDALGGL